MRTLVALLLASAPLAAQRPDFSGTWVRQDSVAGPQRAAAGDAAFRRGDMGSGWGTPLTIRQTADSLVVVFDTFSAYDLQPKTRYAFALNGRVTKNVVMISHAESPIESRAHWTGAALEITTRFPPPPAGAPMPTAPDLVQAISLDATGRLVIEARRPDAGGATNTVTTTYTKR